MYQLTKDLFRIPMKAEEVLCSTVYESEALKEFTEEPVKSPKIEEVYGHLKFPKAPADRPYVYASFITETAPFFRRTTFSTRPAATPRFSSSCSSGPRPMRSSAAPEP